MSSGTVFTRLNDFSQSSDGVYRQDEAAAFNYSDGEQSEHRLRSILESAQDLSSDSVELEQQIVDWPTEYHLSSTRANLLRGLNLEGVNTVLELGCGCGSISRYLGENDALEVDSVEGSAVRASLAALRCGDLPNVSISNGNFNTLQFPEAHYDLVLFVGVAEYAGRFSERESDEAALQDLLALAKRAIKPDGVVLIAIENRVGLKYAMGACEDHYGVPYIGLDNYPESTGIRTYSKVEWQSQIAQAGFDACHFAYPFPDYKIPNCIVSEHCSPDNLDLQQALRTNKSRDYLSSFDLGALESKLWSALASAGVLGDLANSFMLLLGQDKARLMKMMDFELRSYTVSDHAYLVETSAAPHAENDKQTIARQNHLKHLKRELEHHKQHAIELENQLGLIKRSRGWQLLHKIRSLFGGS